MLVVADGMQNLSRIGVACFWSATTFPKWILVADTQSLFSDLVTTVPAALWDFTKVELPDAAECCFL